MCYFFSLLGLCFLVQWRNVSFQSCHNEWEINVSFQCLISWLTLSYLGIYSDIVISRYIYCTLLQLYESIQLCHTCFNPRWRSYFPAKPPDHTSDTFSIRTFSVLYLSNLFSDAFVNSQEWTLSRTVPELKLVCASWQYFRIIN